MKRIILASFILFVFILSAFNPPQTNALTKEGDSKCYYCPSKNGYDVVAYPGGKNLPGPSCLYTPTGCVLGCFEDEQPAASGGTCSASQECNNYQGCVGSGGGSCTPPAGGCSDESNSSCRNPSSCTNMYCTVEEDGNVYQWTLAYYQETNLQGTCRPLASAPAAAPRGRCTDNSNCTGGATCDIATGVCTDPHPNAPISRPCKDGWSIEKGCSSISTAIGDVTTQPNSFISFLLGIVLSLAGVILLLLLIINGYKLMTSQGDPEKIKDAREGIIAAISGILLIIFSLVILEFITVNILGIPGFGS